MYFVPNGFRIFMQVILPYLRISEKEKEQLVEDPKEYVNYQIDICSKQKSGTYKTTAARLLESLVDHVDGFLTFVIDFTIELMNYLL